MEKQNYTLQTGFELYQPLQIQNGLSNSMGSIELMSLAFRKLWKPSTRYPWNVVSHMMTGKAFAHALLFIFDCTSFIQNICFQEPGM